MCVRFCWFWTIRFLINGFTFFGSSRPVWNVRWSKNLWVETDWSEIFALNALELKQIHLRFLFYLEHSWTLLRIFESKQIHLNFCFNLNTLEHSWESLSWNRFIWIFVLTWTLLNILEPKQIHLNFVLTWTLLNRNRFIWDFCFYLDTLEHSWVETNQSNILF